MKRSLTIYFGITGLVVSIMSMVLTTYITWKDDPNLEKIITDIFTTFVNYSMIYSYLIWTIFLTIYGVISLYEKIHKTGPIKNINTLEVRNFTYVLWYWGPAAAFFQHAALFFDPEVAPLLKPIFSEDYKLIGIGLALILGFWGLHHVVIGRVYINGHWDPDIHSYENHKIVEAGIYKKIRHPIYGGQIFLTMSLFFMWNNWILIMLPLATIYANHKRAKKEEVELSRLLPDTYLKYKRLTPSYMGFGCLPLLWTYKND